jgi:hypothetical protein
MINVVIPSYKRSDNLLGKDYFYMAKYVVPYSQKEDYLKVLTEERIITIPDDEDGSIGKKRNWILKNIPRPLIMIDDDVKHLMLYEKRKENPGGKKMDKELLNDFFESLVLLSKDFDSRMFGLLPITDFGSVNEYKPFSLTNMVLGPFQGHLEHDLYFDESVGSKDDYDMCLQQMNKYKKVLRYNKVGYMDANDKKIPGGIVSYRSMDKEIEWCEKIMKKWGTKIIEYKLPPVKLTDVLNASKFNPPISGV